ncbi:PREDICTED: putative uncharacterized protein DDB_G0282499 [Rhagoletis zephyria]|uniref:putative uncharacterized protein DDB_G0282499 n=1 Tax=Rhagoletis zephyria TaxID=28612 RepID=UPI0008114AF8|nr:PREDICTED: putative uncharacterized protein DDB_G0282499 [Rhagoletis zephyria]
MIELKMNAAVDSAANSKQNNISVKYKKCKNNNRNSLNNNSNNECYSCSIADSNSALLCVATVEQRVQNSEQIWLNTLQQQKQQADTTNHSESKDAHHHQQYYDHHHHRLQHSQQQQQQQQHLHDHRQQQQQQCLTTVRYAEHVQQQNEQHKQPFPIHAPEHRQQQFNQQQPKPEGRQQQQQQQQQHRQRLRRWPTHCYADTIRCETSNNESSSSNSEIDSDHTTDRSKFNPMQASLHSFTTSSSTTSTSSTTTSSSYVSSSTRGCTSSSTVTAAAVNAVASAVGNLRGLYAFTTATTTSQAATPTLYLWWLFGVCLILFTNGGRDWRSTALTRTTFMVAASYLEPDELIHELDRPGEWS